MKRCSSCKQEKDQSEFYTDKKAKDGLKSQCKKCHSLCSVRTRDIDKHRESNKNWMRRSKYYTREEVRERELLRCRVKNRSWHAKARNLANRAVDLGFLVRPDVCSVCGAEGVKTHAHHDDYSKPLDVRWVCIDCHGKLHRKIIK
jgi:hypothetical protein